VKERQLADGRGGGAKSYDREKAWSFINPSILWVGRYFFSLGVILMPSNILLEKRRAGCV
jgi:hypothetical protein